MNIVPCGTVELDLSNYEIIRRAAETQRTKPTIRNVSTDDYHPSDYETIHLVIRCPSIHQFQLFGPLYHAFHLLHLC